MTLYFFVSKCGIFVSKLGICIPHLGMVVPWLEICACCGSSQKVFLLEWHSILLVLIVRATWNFGLALLCPYAKKG